MQSLLPNYVNYINSAQNSFKIMQEATVLIFVINTLSKEYRKFLSFEEHITEICDIQAICASIENMLLTANNLGLGSLWIGDIFFVYPELKHWLNKKGEIIAYIALLGYADEKPVVRPRKDFDKIGQ
ncbi:nitroreductase family protein [Megamonas funiformis]|uniref:nitroreductase family protein n=2 Tax=Selenomonadaceae TaxID=1843491 RepID=UPI0026752083|nr:nitroreductase family protein [Megamonas funiformis]